MSDQMQSADQYMGAENNSHDKGRAPPGTGGVPMRSRIIILLGYMIILAAMILIYNNENNFFAGQKFRARIDAHIRHVPTDAPDPDNNGKLVHISGPLETNEILADEKLYISFNAIKLERHVKMYQWQEIPPEKEGYPYRYHGEWEMEPIDSQGFHTPEGHENPPMPLRTVDYAVTSSHIGGFSLAPGFIREMAGYEKLPLTSGLYAQINPDFSNYKLDGTRLYKGANPDKPAIGDVKVSFQAVEAGSTVSIIGRQQGNVIRPFSNNQGQKMVLMRSGNIDAATMRGWHGPVLAVVCALRLTGWLVMAIGMYMAFSRRLSKGLNAAKAWLTILLTTSSVTLIIIAAVWFNTLPVMAMALLVVASALLITVAFIHKKSDGSAENANASEPVPQSIPKGVKYFKVQGSVKKHDAA